MRRLYRYFIVIFLFIFVGIINVSANVKVDVHSPQTGSKICVLSSKLDQGHYMYGWLSNTSPNVELRTWPGEELVADNNGIYCYTVQNDNAFDMIIFNNNQDVQTIDLSTIYTVDDNGDVVPGIINNYLYVFENDYIENVGNYGVWYVYDTHALDDLISTGNARRGNYLSYTKTSYNNFINTYNSVNEFNNYSGNTDSKLVISSDNNVYSSEYINKYNQLNNSIGALKNRLNIIHEDNITGGSISTSYVDEESDANNKVKINPTVENGYEISSVKAYKINDDSNSNIILGDELPVTSNNSFYYTEFSDESVSEAKGIYVDTRFSKKTYTIVFTVDRNGKIINEDSGNEIDVDQVIDVEHGSNFFARIVANEGYELKSATVNGVQYSVGDNILRMENINGNQEVVITFTIKSYIIKVDDVDYTFVYGTNYNDIIKKINTYKEGYTFDGLVDKNKNKISTSYTVKHNDVLYTVFRDNSDNNIINPDTGFKLLKVLLFGIIVFGLIYWNGNIVNNKDKAKSIIKK